MTEINKGIVEYAKKLSWHDKPETMESLRADIKTLRKREKVLVEALEFYADKRIWKMQRIHYEVPNEGCDDFREIDADEGYVAKKTLAKLEKE